MFILFKIKSNSESDLPLEEQIGEVLVNTDNINYLASLPGSGVAIAFNSPVTHISDSNNIMVVNSSLHEIKEILKEKGLM